VEVNICAILEIYILKLQTSMAGDKRTIDGKIGLFLPFFDFSLYNVSNLKPRFILIIITFPLEKKLAV